MSLNRKNGLKEIIFVASSTLLLLSAANTVFADQNSFTTDESENNLSTEVISQQKDIQITKADTANNSSVVESTSAAPTTNKQNVPQATTTANNAAALKADNFNIGDPNFPRVDTVDLASYNSYLTQSDYNALRNQGVKTAIVKLTEGTSYRNPAASEIQGARNAGLNIAVYHFAWFTNAAEASGEANYFLNAIRRFGLDTNTVVIADMESSAVLNGNGANNLNAFWNTLRANGYNNDVVYTSLNYDQNYGFSNTVGKKKTWIAQYPYYPRVNNLQHQEYGAWQFSSTAYINGKGPIDASIDYNGIFDADRYEEKYENGSWHLYINGKMQTGFHRLPDGRVLYYNENGQLQNGLTKAGDGHTYYFSTTNGDMYRGEKYMDGNWYYFDINNGQMATGFTKLPDGRTIYYDNDGHIVNGGKNINGKEYYFSKEDGHLVTNSLVYDSESHLIKYYGEDGRLQHGIVSIDGENWNFRDSDGALKVSTPSTLIIEGMKYEIMPSGEIKVY